MIMAEEKKEAKKPHERPHHAQEAKLDERLIVRVADVDLDGKKPVALALVKIRGIGMRTAKNIAVALERETGANVSVELGKLEEANVKKLQEIVLDPAKFRIPAWSLNRQKDMETGGSKHIVMAELEFAKRTDLQRLAEIKSYRGLRHSWGLTVRGQRTKSTHRGKGKVVGVVRKEVKK
ncbi:MAG: 30S ribosomal protein S13 [archaeon]|nr:30S ribosomal protein S13 [archaeon]